MTGQAEQLSSTFLIPDLAVCFSSSEEVLTSAFPTMAFGVDL